MKHILISAFAVALAFYSCEQVKKEAAKPKKEDMKINRAGC